jgi:hypothetical protein
MGMIASVTEKAKLFCGIISCKCEEKYILALEKKFGKIDLISNIIDFDFSDYYNVEMGNDLKRFWISFEKPISVDKLSETKIFTNFIESSFSINNNRQINIDPGYVTLANIVLATTKNYSHRVCILNGIYAEVTMIYKNGMFTKLPWTYPDYLSKDAIDFFLNVRSIIRYNYKFIND